MLSTRAALVPPNSPLDATVALENCEYRGAGGFDTPHALNRPSDHHPVETLNVVEVKDDANEPGINCDRVLIFMERPALVVV